MHPRRLISQLSRPVHHETEFTPISRCLSVRSSVFPNQRGRSWTERPSFKSLVVTERGRRASSSVIPFSRGSALEPPPPDVSSFLFRQRIVYLGMALVPPVTRLILAEFLYLQHEDEKKPIYLYINSTGTMKGDKTYGHETEALAIYDIMSYIKTPIFTLCVGNAWGEAAMLLAAGARGNRAALPSAKSIIVSTVDIEGDIYHILKVEVLSRHTGKPPEVIEADIRRPKYFSPSEAVEYGIIDKVLYNEKSPEDKGLVTELKASQLM
ncbi:hypothetical protein Cgig2_019879 [Carnegiea gigantea]|uniref:ATP-dependent Clp protease proteolytic subunit n=1 Tax=Carnegiea gigantea TaxID=171969 RepID=A0A9Q1KK70_9CARY|nr:hypothetical protein Cgig2_019879 [Carnegiea gigantea]